MPVTIQPTTLKYKDVGGTFHSADCLKGDTGLTPDLSIGTVETGDAGSSASVTITGTTDEPVLNFTIPKGDTGYPTDAQVTTAVDAYLATAITNPDSPPLDRTLTSSSSATPADITGSLKSDFEYNENCDRAGFIPYACNGSNTNILTVSQNGNEITINGTSNATAGQVTTKILISDHIHSWNSGTTPTADLVYSIPIRKGRKYQIKATVVSGERDAGQGAGYISARLYGNGGVNIAEAIVGINDTESVAIGEASADTMAQVRVLVARLMTVTNLVVRITVEDVTLQEEKQDKLTFDSVPTINSTNPVTSNGIYSETKRIKDAIGEQQERIISGVSSGYYWNSETSIAVKTAYSTYKAYDPIEVEPGEKVRLFCSLTGSSSKQYPFLFVDDDYTIISHEGGRVTLVDVTVNVPDGATKLLMTCGTGRKCDAYRITLKPVPDNIFTGTFDYKDKNIAIIGDSISTNGDYSASNPLGNVPEIVVQDEDIGEELSAYVTYYDVGTTIGGHEIVESEVGTELTFTPVDGDQGKMIGKPKNNNTATTDVWWEVAAGILEFNPIPVCWSGSSITDHEENSTEDGHYIYKCAHSFHPSQVRKCGIRTPGSMERTAPDMIIIYRGTNDLSHSPYSRLTDDLDSFPTTYPETDIYDDGGTTRYSFVKGMRMLIKTLREAYPETKIVLCTLNYFRRLSHTAIYTNNGTDNWLKYNDMIRRIADYECCDLIEFDKDGLNYWNAKNGYYNEGTSDTAYWTHPNTKGQARLGSRALVDMRKVNDMTVPTE